jgi:glycosyltransferase involved in cell wall biosynthesis
MRIVYLHQYYVTPRQPGGTRSYEMARRLARNGHEVHVVTTDTLAPRAALSWRTTVENGVHVHRLPVPYRNAMSYRRRMWSFAHYALGSARLATRLHPDVVLATSTPLTVAIPGVVAARTRRVPFVFEVRDLWPELPIEIGALRNPVARWLAFALARTAYRNAAHVIALSPGMAEGVAAQGYPPERITVIPNGCDTEVFTVPDDEARSFRAELPWLGDRPLITYAGTFGVVNGLDHLVRIAARMLEIDPEVRFLLVGDGRTYEDVREFAGRLGVLDRNLFLMTGVPKSAMPRILAASTVVTSLFLPLDGMRHNSANKFFDGLAAGRPVAVNYGGWHADLLTEHGAGLVLDPADAELGAQALARVVHDDAWLAAAGASARALADREFSRDLLAGRFEAVLTGTRATALQESGASEASAREAFRGIA